jgi:hypothetical protein
MWACVSVQTPHGKHSATNKHRAPRAPVVAQHLADQLLPVRRGRFGGCLLLLLLLLLLLFLLLLLLLLLCPVVGRTAWLLLLLLLVAGLLDLLLLLLLLLLLVALGFRPRRWRAARIINTTTTAVVVAALRRACCVVVGRRAARALPRVRALFSHLHVFVVHVVCVCLYLPRGLWGCIYRESKLLPSHHLRSFLKPRQSSILKRFNNRFTKAFDF